MLVELIEFVVVLVAGLLALQRGQRVSHDSSAAWRTTEIGLARSVTTARIAVVMLSPATARPSHRVHVLAHRRPLGAGRRRQTVLCYHRRFHTDPADVRDRLFDRRSAVVCQKLKLTGMQFGYFTSLLT